MPVLEDDWDYFVVQAWLRQRPIVEARTFVTSFSTFSRPAALRCDDGNVYVVKGAQTSRAAFNDHVVADLGRHLDAPVPRLSLVNMPLDLISAQPELAHYQPGLAHGSLFIDGCTDREGIGHIGLPENRGRFASLAVLYGWAFGADHQFIYEKAAPQLVHSVDHGHFFFGPAPNWALGTLTAAPTAAPDATIITPCNTTPAELAAPLGRLATIEREAIAEAVGRPPDSWGVSLAERIGLARYLWKRQQELLGR